MTSKRPLILLIILFGILFLLRGPLRGLDIGHMSMPWQQAASTSVPGIPGGDIQAIDDSSAGLVTETVKSASSQVGASKGILTAPPSELKVGDSSLSIAGIVAFTNSERAKRQFPSLKNNRALNASAEEKLADMFSKQYFEHESPKGVSVADLIRNENYQYIVVGENLALGNFGGDQQVVTAWMNSPGHKANILDPRFQEIGIAVGKGLYKGKEQWIAVQHFAKPLSACPGPDAELRDKISAHTADLAGREKTLSDLKARIDSSKSNDEGYRADVERYNNLVGEYNTYLESLKDEISRYNEQVRAFNSCAGLAAVKKIQLLAQ